MLVPTFLSSHLDCCNSMSYGIGDNLLQSLQIIRICVTMGARKFDHITSVLHELHWLSVCHHVTFQLAANMFSCLNVLMQAY